jgi:hypothetical protein
MTLHPLRTTHPITSGVAGLQLTRMPKNVVYKYTPWKGISYRPRILPPEQSEPPEPRK